MICDCGHDFDLHDEDREFSNCCSVCDCMSCGITQLVDLQIIPDLFKTSTYNLKEPFSYVAIGSSC